MNWTRFTLNFALVMGVASFAWGERPRETPTCEFAGGAYYRSNNTLYLKSFADSQSKVEINDIAVNCLRCNAPSSFPVVVERSTALAANSTIMLPIDFKIETNSCVTFYNPVSLSTDDNGEWTVMVKHQMSEGRAHRPMLLAVKVNEDECRNVKEIEFLSSGELQSTSHVNTGSSLYNSKTGREDWVFQGTYDFIRWESGNSDLGKVYGYAAKDDGSVSAGQFVKAGNNAFIPPLRAYLKYVGPASLSKSTDNGDYELPETIKVKIVDDEGKTIGSARLNTTTGSITEVNRWFDLKGRELKGKPENKGLFVGKKTNRP